MILGLASCFPPITAFPSFCVFSVPRNPNFHLGLLIPALFRRRILIYQFPPFRPGATEVHLILDVRTHGARSIFDPSMASLQGPALLAFNNRAFTDRDLDNIQHIACGGKSDDLGKTGQFGVGFNSAYWLTEVPSFVSRDFACFFDPSKRYIPHLGKRPGRKYELTMAAQYRDQFTPYELPELGWGVNGRFPGTLFRFPPADGGSGEGERPGEGGVLGD